MRDGIDMEDDIERSFGQMKKGIAGSGCVGLYGSVSVGFRWWWWMLRMNWKALLVYYWTLFG